MRARVAQGEAEGFEYQRSWPSHDLASVFNAGPTKKV